MSRDHVTFKYQCQTESASRPSVSAASRRQKKGPTCLPESARNLVVRVQRVNPGGTNISAGHAAFLVQNQTI